MRAVNHQALLEFLSALLAGTAILVSLLDGTYLHYVTPRTQPFLLFSLAVLLCWSLTSFLRISRPRYRSRGARALLLALPALPLLASVAPLAVSDFSSAYLRMNPAEEFFDRSMGALPESDFFAFGNWRSDGGRRPFEPEFEEGVLVVRSKSFYPALLELYSDPDRWEGTAVRIEGFVFRDLCETDSICEGEFILARLLMWCCAADVVPMGPVCEYEGASELDEGEWIAVEGRIRVGEYEGKKEPRIVVLGVERGREAQLGYVYP